MSDTLHKIFSFEFYSLTEGKKEKNDFVQNSAQNYSFKTFWSFEIFTIFGRLSENFEKRL